MLNSIQSCKVKSYKVLFLSFALLLVPCIGKAETITQNPDILSSSIKEEMIEQTIQRRQSSHKENSKDFKLSDFSGKWVVKIASIGGISGATSIGASFISVGQAEIKNNGRGEFNVISGSTYSGIPAQFDNFSFGPGVVFIHLTLTDPKNGAGSFSVVGGGVNDVVNFIATRSAKTGKIVRLEGFRFSSATSASNLVSYVLTQQNESY